MTELSYYGLYSKCLFGLRNDVRVSLTSIEVLIRCFGIR